MSTGIRLSVDEAWDVLAAAHTGILTTLRADGTPVTLPVWFVALDRTICLAAPSGTKKIARIRRDPRASFLVESGDRWDELQAVHVSGTIEVVEDEPTTGRIDRALHEKYQPFQTPLGAMPDLARLHYAGRTFLRLLPRGRFLTWDNSRMELA